MVCPYTLGQFRSQVMERILLDVRGKLIFHSFKAAVFLESQHREFHFNTGLGAGLTK